MAYRGTAAGERAQPTAAFGICPDNLLQVWASTRSASSTLQFQMRRD